MRRFELPARARACGGGGGIAGGAIWSANSGADANANSVTDVVAGAGNRSVEVLAGCHCRREVSRVSVLIDGPDLWRGNRRRGHYGRNHRGCARRHRGDGRRKAHGRERRSRDSRQSLHGRQRRGGGDSGWGDGSRELLRCGDRNRRARRRELPRRPPLRASRSGLAVLRQQPAARPHLRPVPVRPRTRGRRTRCNSSPTPEFPARIANTASYTPLLKALTVHSRTGKARTEDDPSELPVEPHVGPQFPYSCGRRLTNLWRPRRYSAPKRWLAPSRRGASHPGPLRARPNRWK